MHNEAVEAEQRSGPFGAKGVGESGTFAVSPAIANAIEDAVGVRLTTLPLTAEQVYRAMCVARANHWKSENEYFDVQRERGIFSSPRRGEGRGEGAGSM